jgi:biotin operon repressor
MSMLLMVKAMNTRVGNPLRKLVLIKLADNANDSGECWPSHQHIADMCEISKRSVINHISALEEMGLLKIEARIRNNEKQSNVYHLRLESSSAGDAPGSAGDSLPGSAGAAHRTSHSSEPVNEPSPIAPKGDDDEVSFSKIVDMYHECLDSLPTVRMMTSARRKALRSRIREDAKRKDPEWWRGYFEYAASIPFLAGKGESDWKPNFDWLINETNMVKVIEGKYQND